MIGFRKILGILSLMLGAFALWSLLPGADQKDTTLVPLLILSPWILTSSAVKVFMFRGGTSFRYPMLGLLFWFVFSSVLTIVWLAGLVSYFLMNPALFFFWILCWPIIDFIDIGFILFLTARQERAERTITYPGGGGSNSFSGIGGDSGIDIDDSLSRADNDGIDDLDDVFDGD